MRHYYVKLYIYVCVVSLVQLSSISVSDGEQWSNMIKHMDCWLQSGWGCWHVVLTQTMTAGEQSGFAAHRRPVHAMVRRGVMRVFDFSPHLCVGFLFLVVRSRLPPSAPPPPPAARRPPPHTQLVRTQLAHTQFAHTLHTHNLLTHSLFTHNLLTHNLLTHNLSTHNLLTHNLFTDNLLTHNLLTHAHTTCSHTHAHTHTHLVHAQLALTH